MHLLLEFIFSLKDCGSDCQQRDGLEAAHAHPPPLVGAAVIGGIGASMPVKPTPPTSPSQHGLSQQQQGVRSPLPYKQYGSNIASELGRGGVPVHQNNTSLSNNQHIKQNSSTSPNSALTTPNPPIALVNNNQLRQSPTGNGNTPPISRPSLNSGTCGKRDISPTRVRQSTPSPKLDRYSSMSSGERKQTPSMSSSNEANIRQGTSPGKQHSPTATNNPNYQSKLVGGSNNVSTEQQPTIKRPRKGSGGVNPKQQQTSLQGTNNTDSVSDHNF